MWGLQKLLIVAKLAATADSHLPCVNQRVAKLEPCLPTGQESGTLMVLDVPQPAPLFLRISSASLNSITVSA